MPVAKTYMRCDILGDPFTRNGRKYVTIETPTGVTKNVRWYTQAEWDRMYPDLAGKNEIKYRDILGFGDAGYITIYFGDTYKNLNWFKAAPECRYHKTWGQYTPSAETVSSILPEGVKTAILTWDAVRNEADQVDFDKAANAVDALIYEPSNSQFVGEIGDRTLFELTIKKAIELDGMYGPSTMHVMEDPDGNVFIWTTSTKTLGKGTTYLLRGTVSDHRTYKNVNQTILKRCKVVKELC